jgi:hypothetical protein
MATLCPPGAGRRLSAIASLVLAIACGDDKQSAPGNGGADAGPTVAVQVAPTSGLHTTEAGGQDTFTVALTAAPIADVIVALTTSDSTEGRVVPAIVSFTIDDWSFPRVLPVTGVDDDVADGDATYFVLTAAVVSDDERYDGLDPDDVEVTNGDDDTPGVTVTAQAGGLKTAEVGSGDSFTIVLDSQPTGDVVIPLASSDPGEGTLALEAVTFTPLDWNVPQVIEVSGVDDDEADGDQGYRIVTAPAVSLDQGYSGLDTRDLDATNLDDDAVGVLVTAGADPLITGENGDSATFTIRLASRPTGDVVVRVQSSDESEGVVAPTFILFTPGGWQVPRQVTVTGVDDDVPDLDQDYLVSFTVTSDSDAAYDGLAVESLALRNIDDDF